ncbi:hypothetical protein DSCW_17730 [Desulfosarcina widdelii]|uniref:Bacteriophage T5 Orf172 DNA-binding domain-containing protein n=1 Tax=Desulfosarcina widdelii TaxID=947919 RepID=A0A5K7YY97_9BACT|nr:GIY-YIG nuclease family protein [Desulfosarcina widdelii]BBO74356.1 hypothetical protein DSCW_17730 [Desulfosarcina widdelii]
MGGWIYIIEEMGQHLFKVGYTTTNPHDRLRQLQTGNGSKLDLLSAFTCQYPEDFEREFHKLLEKQAQRMQGEWFALPREQMLDILLHILGGIAEIEGGIRFQVSSLSTRPSEAKHLVEQGYSNNQQQNINVEAIRERVLRSTEGRSSGCYSTFSAFGPVRVGDIGGSYFGEIDVPFEAIAIGGPTHSGYNDHALALVPKIHDNSEANADFFAHARSDVIALLNEIDRLCSNEK